MDYIKQLNAFWEKAEQDMDLKPTSSFVYMALLQINNRAGWKDKFRAVYSQVLAMTGLNVKTYYSALDELVNGGYIEWERSSNQYQASVFSIKVLYQNLEKQRKSDGKARGKATETHGVKQRKSNGNILKHINLKNNKTYKPKRESVFTPPTLEEVVDFFKEKNFSETHAKKAFEYYQVAGWKDSKGQQVKNWKQKMIAVWMKEDQSQKNYGNSQKQIRSERREPSTGGFGQL